MSKELVERLRKRTVRVHDLSGVGYNDDEDCHAAADLIERQSKTIKEMREAFEMWECPRPANSRPDDFTVGQCLNANECGCVAQVCRSPSNKGKGEGE